MARPMPREAPVTRATWPAIATSLMPAAPSPRPATPGRDSVGRHRLGVDALDHAGQHLARAALDDVRQPARAQRLHHLDPAHRAEGLAVERVADRRRHRSRTATSMLLTTGIRGAANAIVGQALAQRARRPASSAREWNGADTGSGSARLAPIALSTSQAFSTPALRAGDHGLPRVVEVDGLDDLAAVGRGAWRSLRAPRRRPGRGSPPSRRRRPAPPPASPGRESAPAAARRPASARRRRPARVYSPSECPATAAGSRAAFGAARRGSRRCRRVSITGWVLVVRSSCSFGPSWISAADVLAERGRGLVAASRAPPGGRPRRRACRPPASPGRERRMQRSHARCPAGFGSAQKSSSTAPQVKPPPTPSSITRVAALDAAVAHRHVERQRDRRGRGVAVLRRR